MCCGDKTYLDSVGLFEGQSMRDVHGLKRWTTMTLLLFLKFEMGPSEHDFAAEEQL